MNYHHVTGGLLIAAVAAVAPGLADAADYHHVNITAPSPSEAVNWYTQHMDCQPISDRRDAADCDGVKLVFVVQPTMGSTQGTGINHISFSFPDLTAKMAELESVGVRGSGVRLQRFPDGSTLRDVPGLVHDRVHLRSLGNSDRACGRHRLSRLSSHPPERHRPRGHSGLVSRRDGRRAGQLERATERSTF